VLIAQARGRELVPAHITFDYAGHDGKVSALEPFVGSSGILAAVAITTEALDQIEDTLVLAAESDLGVELEEATVRRLLMLSATATGIMGSASNPSINAMLERRQAEIEHQISDRNSRFFEIEAEKLDGWAEDLKIGLEREIKDLDRQIREAKRTATAAPTLEAKLAGQKQVKSLEVQRNQRRKSLFEAQDDIDRRRGELIAAMEKKLLQSVNVQPLFTVRWTLPE
jgi:adenine-specific DNA-methyltransferase